MVARTHVVASLALALGACDASPIADAGPTDVGVDAAVTAPTDQLDLLLMIDNSGSMAEEQASVDEAIPRLLGVLTSGHDPSERIADFSPVRSLHLGLITSDMGLGDQTDLVGCPPGLGDDGLMQLRARYPSARCMPDYAARYPATPNVFAFEAADTTRTVAEVAADATCVASFGTDGCGVELQLDAPLKALSLTPTATGESPVGWTRPGYRPPTFFSGLPGHGDDPTTNGAFLRPGSVLAILLVTDEDDCSTPNFRIFSPSDPHYSMFSFGLRCIGWASELHPISRYVDGFVGLRADPSRLVFAAIAGVPPALVGRSSAEIAADPEMSPIPDPADPTHRLRTACVSPGARGVAYPAQRIAQVAAGLEAQGARTTLQTVCDTDFGGAFDAILAQIADALAGTPVR